MHSSHRRHQVRTRLETIIQQRLKIHLQILCILLKKVSHCYIIFSFIGHRPCWTQVTGYVLRIWGLVDTGWVGWRWPPLVLPFRYGGLFRGKTKKPGHTPDFGLG